MSGIGLTSSEKQQIINDAEALILAADTTADIYRPTVQGEDTFDGPYDADKNYVSSPAVDFVIDNNSEILEPEADAVADFILGTDVKKRDYIVFRGLKYIADSVKPYEMFGVQTHVRAYLGNLKDE